MNDVGVAVIILSKEDKTRSSMQRRAMQELSTKCKRCARLFKPEEFYVVSGERDSWRYKKAFSQSIFVWNLY
jgi:hypothetical protein